MCGLIAILNRGAPLDRSSLDHGLAALRHRGPDAQKTLLETLASPSQGQPAISIGLGHARLSIIDLGTRSDQPFSDGAHTLLFNGEIYNYRDLRANMSARGETFRTQGDTEALLKLLIRDGVEGLRAINGMWAFCWFDRAHRRLTAVRDRYGKKPLFYMIDGDRIAFASEIGSLLAAMKRKPVAQESAVASFLAEGWLFPRSDGATHIEGVREVPPGGCVEIDLDFWTIHERRILDAASSPERVDDAPLGDLLADAVTARLVSDRKVGLLLSGGVDSSLLLSILSAKGLLDQVVCVTGEAGKSDDSRYARQCVAALGGKAIEVPLDYGAGSVDHFLAVCRHQEKPFPLIGNVLGMSALYAAVGADDVRVVLDGTGADEIFGGYWSRQAGFAMRDAARAGDRAWLDQLREGGALPVAFGALSDRAAAELPLPSPARDLLHPDELGLLSRDGAKAVEEAASSDPLVNFTGGLAEAMTLDARAGRMQEWLWQNDRNAMAASVENRSPFLDHRLARFLRTPYHAKLGGRWNKLELRSLFAQFAPLPTASRPEKQGFRWVYGRFMRANRAWIVELIRASRIARRFIDIERALAATIDDDAFTESRIIKRALVLAGLEAEGKIA